MMLIITLVYKLQTNKSYSLYKLIFKLFIVYTFVSIYIIYFDNRGFKETLIYTLISLIPSFYYLIFYIYYIKTYEIDLSD